jgi:hypothetical protein
MPKKCGNIILNYPFWFITCLTMGTFGAKNAIDANIEWILQSLDALRLVSNRRKVRSCKGERVGSSS